MHGLIHVELERFARGHVGDEAWHAAVADAGLTGRLYEAGQQYEDAEMVGLVVALAKAMDAGPQALLEKFGEALVPPLLDNYGGLVDAEWRTIELIANVEELIHRVLRATDPAARPPLLTTTLRGPDRLLVIYASERRMCGVAKGIIRGVAAHYGEAVELTEESCMLTGGRTCNIAVQRVTENYETHAPAG